MKYSVIFDMDGVLVDSEPVIEAAAIAGLAEYGVIACPEDFKPFIGAGEDRYIGGVAEKHGTPYKLEMKKRVYEIYVDIVPTCIKLYEGVREMLQKMKAEGCRMALASSADIVKIEANLKAAGISPSLFDVVVSGEDVVQKKPFPEIFLKAAGKLGAEPSCCVVVEDAVNGIMAAKAAGMKCIAVTTSFSADTLQKEEPDHICESTTEVYDIWRRL